MAHGLCLRPKTQGRFACTWRQERILRPNRPLHYLTNQFHDTNDVSMIRSGDSVRFTPNEVEEFRQVGLDFSDVKRQRDIEREVSRWAHTLGDERFELLEKIASALAKAKELKLPSGLDVVAPADSPR